MIFLKIAIKDVKLLLSDKKTLLTLLGTPLALTLILGLALGSMWGTEMPASQVLYSNEDEGLWGTILFDEVFAIPELAEKFYTVAVTDHEEARESVRRGQATAFIHIPADFSKELSGGGETGLSMWGDPGSSIRVQVVEAVVERFAAEVSVRRVIYETVGEVMPEVPVNPDRVEEVLSALQVKTVPEDGFDRDNGFSPAAMDYYAAGMGVMYLLFTANAGAGRFIQERHDKTLARILQSPVSRLQITAGKFLGIFFAGVCQFAVIVFASALLFGVNWGNPLGVAILSLGAVCGATGIGLIIAAFSKTAASVDAMGSLIILSMSALGGSMFPVFAMPPVVQTLSKITLNSWAMEGFMKLMFEGGGPFSILLYAGVMAAGGLLLSLAAGTRLSREVS
ncbi:MAG: ABC transporter permease [Candidatus Contubernalis sp.]|nr:ABC transporter permease [Candidatus Contubernalis sp.]